MGGSQIAANATDISADVNSTPIDLAISAVGIDPLVEAEPPAYAL